MNLVTELEKALQGAGLSPTVTYDEDDDFFPTVHVGEWGIGVDGACLNVGLGPYSVTHPEEETEEGEPAFQMSPMLMKPEDVVAYLKEQGACS